MTHHFVVCLNNEDYPASLEVRKLYEALPDNEADKLGQIRVIDESGEDYLYPKELFLPIPLTKKLEKRVSETA